MIDLLWSRPEVVLAGSLAAWAAGTLALGLLWLLGRTVRRVTAALATRDARRREARRVAVVLREEIRLARKAIETLAAGPAADRADDPSDAAASAAVVAASLAGPGRSGRFLLALREELTRLPSAALVAVVRFYDVEARVGSLLAAPGGGPAAAASERHAELMQHAVDTAREAERQLTQVAGQIKASGAGHRPKPPRR